MDIIRVRGGKRLTGTVHISGAKNSALKLIAATILAPGKSTLYNVPKISDVSVMSEVLRSLGAHVEASDHELIIDTTSVDKHQAAYELVVKMRASVAVLGPLLGRFGKAVVAMPGGCRIGERKLDLHMIGLEALGVEFTTDHGNIYAEAKHGLKGASVYLDFPSVGATENLMMAAVKAEGTTVIDNAAREPEIVDLANMLSEMGAIISGAGSPTITIEGVSELHPVNHKTVGDRIEAGTFVVAGALTGGPLTVEGFNPKHLDLVLHKIEGMGVTIERHENGVTVSSEGTFKPADVQTLPYPGFPTDMQAQIMVMALLADGNSIITENVFENRFMLTAELARMGGEVRLDGHHALVTGPCHLSGAPVESTDLRGGASLVLAGLVADGLTEVSGIKHIDRGYEYFVEKFAAIGADIERIRVD